MTFKSTIVKLAVIGMVLGTTMFSWASELKTANTINPDADVSILFDEAGKAYDEGDLTRASSLYQKIITDHYANASVFFNLGNTYFRKGETGEAILNFKRALLLEPRNNDTKANLRFALENAGALVPKANIIDRLMRNFTRREWHILATLCWWTLAVLCIAHMFMPFAKRILQRTIGMVVLLLLISLAGLYTVHQMESKPEGVVIEPRQNALSAPLAGSTILFNLPEGSVVRITEKSGQWLHVSAGKQSGWIRKDSCIPVYPLPY